MATINKTNPSYARVKVQVDLTATLSNCAEVEVVNNKTNETMVQSIRIQYDMMPKYCNTSKLKDMKRRNIGVYTHS